MMITPRREVDRQPLQVVDRDGVIRLRIERGLRELFDPAAAGREQAQQTGEEGPARFWVPVRGARWPRGFHT